MAHFNTLVYYLPSPKANNGNLHSITHFDFWHDHLEEYFSLNSPSLICMRATELRKRW